MRTLEQTDALDDLITRLGRLRPDMPRRWGTLTAAEMLCHLADVSTATLSRPGAGKGGPRPFRRWLFLYLPLPWPRGVVKTPPKADPRLEGTRPGDFEQDRQRAIEGLRALAAASAADLPASHFVFGRLTARDWKRWAYLHTVHHLRQFGL